MGVVKDKILPKSDNQTIIGTDIDGVKVTLSTQNIWQFIYDVKNAHSDSFDSIRSTIDEFREFVNVYYPDEAPSKDMKVYLNLLLAMDLFFLDLKTNELEVKKS